MGIRILNSLFSANVVKSTPELEEKKKYQSINRRSKLNGFLKKISYESTVFG